MEAQIDAQQTISTAFFPAGPESRLMEKTMNSHPHSVIPFIRSFSFISPKNRMLVRCVRTKKERKNNNKNGNLGPRKTRVNNFFCSKNFGDKFF